MDYLVTPPEETAWRMEPDEFLARLRERWPDAAVREVPGSDPTYAFDFTVTEPGRVDGAWAHSGQMLGLDGEITDVMSLAVWFREQVPAEQPLLFYDPALNGQLTLEPGADPAAAARAYLQDAG